MKFKAAVIVFPLLLSACGDISDTASYNDSYRLYRTSVMKDLGPFHIATFDARESAVYNLENCNTVADLMANQPGVAVSYFCMKGRII